MPTASWECQGRQDHGWFGHGTCVNPPGGAPRVVPGCRGRELHYAAHAAVGVLPRDERARYERWLHEGGMRQLRERAPVWLATALAGEMDAHLVRFGDGDTLSAEQLEQGVALSIADVVADPDDDAARRRAGERMAQLAQSSGRTGVVRIRQGPRAGARPPDQPAGGPGAALSPKWVTTTERDLRNPQSNQYDGLIQAELKEYNDRFRGTPGFVPLDFRIFKALLLVESGGPSNSHWIIRPYQIGNPGDTGLSVLQRQLRGRGRSLVHSYMRISKINRSTIPH